MCSNTSLSSHPALRTHMTNACWVKEGFPCRTENLPKCFPSVLSQMLHSCAATCLPLSLFISLSFLEWRRAWQPTPVLLPGESRGQRSLVGCCPWGRTESDTTEATWHACLHWRRKCPSTPEFCLENPGDGGPWRAAAYGVE